MPGTLLSKQEAFWETKNYKTIVADIFEKLQTVGLQYASNSAFPTTYTHIWTTFRETLKL